MQSKNENAHEIWLALGDLGDWFSRLGGAARYRSFQNSDLGILMVVLLRAKLNDKPRWDEISASQGHSLQKPHDEAATLIPRQLIENAGKVLESVVARLDKLEFKSDSEKQELLRDFARYIDSRLGEDVPTSWRRVMNIVEPLHTP